MNALGFLSRLGVGFVASTLVVSAQVADEATVEKAGNDSLLWLAVLTLVIGVGLGIWQLVKLRKAKRNHAHSSLGGLSDAKAAKRPGY